MCVFEYGVERLINRNKWSTFLGLFIERIFRDELNRTNSSSHDSKATWILNVQNEYGKMKLQDYFVKCIRSIQKFLQY